MYSLIIYVVPFCLVTKGIYYWIIANSKEKSITRKYSIIKTDNPLEFYTKNLFLSKAYLFIGGIIATFMTIFNVCYPANDYKRAISIVLITFFIDILIDVLGKVKCDIDDYDKSQNKEDK